jgi:hypothetical protein
MGNGQISPQDNMELLKKRVMYRQIANEMRADLHCKDDPLYWLQNHTRTRDDHWKEKGTEPFARFSHKPYFPFLFWLLENEKRLFLPKSREMGLSWGVIAWAVRECQWYPNIHCIVQSELATKSIDLVNGTEVPGYARTLYEQQDPFLKVMHPLSKPIDDQPGNLLTWANKSSISGCTVWSQPS